MINPVNENAREEVPPEPRIPNGAYHVSGLDVGTMNLIGANHDPTGEIAFRQIRHTFLKVDVISLTTATLREQKIKHTEIGKNIYALGDSAFELANRMSRVVQRPMKAGVLNPDEINATTILGLLIETVLGKPKTKDALCCYSIPADPVDKDFNVVYHSGIISDLLSDLGYRPQELNEGQAIIFSELADQDFTGIGISCGGGLFNICVSYKAKPLIKFSTNRAGDWIDRNVARVLNTKASRITEIKEKGVKLNAPKNRHEKAIVIYYRNLINYTLRNIKNKLLTIKDVQEFPEPIDIVLGGGSSLIGDFVDIFRNEITKIDFPVPVNEVRLAHDPLYATAKGCLTAALAESKGYVLADTQIEEERNE